MLCFLFVKFVGTSTLIFPIFTQNSIGDDAVLYSISRSTLLTNRVLRHFRFISSCIKMWKIVLIYVLVLNKNLKNPSASVCGLRPSLLPRSFVPESKLSHSVRVINGFAPRTADIFRGKNTVALRATKKAAHCTIYDFYCFCHLINYQKLNR